MQGTFIQGNCTRLQFCRWIVQYSITFGILCAINHYFSVALFQRCGYCLLTYAIVYTFCLASISLFLSTVIFQVFVRKDGKKRILDDLQSVRFEDIPYVMVQLIRKSKERESIHSAPYQIDPQKKPEENLCVACYETAPSIKNIPCGHTVLCRGCNWSLLRVSIENRSILICSWCRTGIKDFEGEMRPNLELIEWDDIKSILKDLEIQKLKRKGTLDISQ